MENGQAGELSRTERLGALTGVFSVPLGGEIRNGALVLAGIPAAAIPASFVVGVLGVSAGFVVAICLVVPATLWAGAVTFFGRAPKRFGRLYTYEQGLVEVPDGVEPDRPRRWHQVVDVREIWEIESGESNAKILAALEIDFLEGPPVRIAAHGDNELATAASAAGADQPPTLMEILKSACSPHIVARDLAVIQSGGAVRRHGVAVDARGLGPDPGSRSAGRKPHTPWASVEAVSLRFDRLRLHPVAGSGARKQDFSLDFKRDPSWRVPFLQLLATFTKVV